jgi:hypothetical protein
MKRSFIIFPVLLHEEVPIFGARVEDAGILGAIVKVDFYPVAMLDPIEEFSVVYFAAEIVDDALIDSRVLPASKIDTVFEFFDGGVWQVYCEVVQEQLEVATYLG